MSWLRRRKDIANDYAAMLATIYNRAQLISEQDKEITRLRQELRDLKNQATPTNPGDIQ
jgi:hypothetical protein